MIADIALYTRVGPSDLIHAACRRQHSYHARIGRVNVGEHQVRTGRELRGDQRQVRKAPDGVIQDCCLDAHLEQAPPFALGDFRVPDDFLAGHHFVFARGLQALPKLILKIQIHVAKHLVRELPPVGEREQPHFPLVHRALPSLLLRLAPARVIARLSSDAYVESPPPVSGAYKAGQLSL